MKRWIERGAMALALCFVAGIALAGVHYTATGKAVPDAVIHWMNGAGAAVEVSEASPLPTKDGNLTDYGTYAVTVGTSAKSLTQLLAQVSTVSPGGATGAVSGIPAGARIAWLQVRSDKTAVNFIANGAPTASFGVEIQPGGMFPVTTPLLTLQLISQGAMSIVTIWFVG